MCVWSLWLRDEEDWWNPFHWTWCKFNTAGNMATILLHRHSYLYLSLNVSHMTVSKLLCKNMKELASDMGVSHMMYSTANILASVTTQWLINYFAVHIIHCYGKSHEFSILLEMQEVKLCCVLWWEVRKVRLLRRCFRLVEVLLSVWLHECLAATTLPSHTHLLQLYSLCYPARS